jgi:biotin transport system permease protein
VFVYTPGETLAHRLDPRTKLAVQTAFAIAAFAHTTPTGLGVLSVVALGCLASARLSPVRVVWSYRFLLPFLFAAVVMRVVTWGPPWIRLGEATEPLLAGYRVVLVVAVSAVYVRTTAARESRAAVEWLVPGKPGRLLGTGVGLVFRLVPVLRRDLLTVRDASKARLGDQRGLRRQMRVVADAGLNQAFGRTDRLSMALQARCFSWNATLPRLRFSAVDVPALLLAVVLCVAVVL